MRNTKRKLVRESNDEKRRKWEGKRQEIRKGEGKEQVKGKKEAL
jgi:hypothetical protein